MSRGLDVTNTYGIHWDPFDAKRVFLSNTDIGLFRSEDGGASWTSSIEGVPLRWRNTTYWVDFDPEVPGLMWGAFSAAHDLPRPKMWRRTRPRYLPGRGGGLDRRRADLEAVRDRRCPKSATTHVLVDPASPKGRRTLYATGFGRGVFKSSRRRDDLGRRRTRASSSRSLSRGGSTRAGDGTLYLVVARRSERGEIGDATRRRALPVHGRRRALDASHACPTARTAPTAWPWIPKDPRRLYLAAWGRATPGRRHGRRDLRVVRWRQGLEAGPARPTSTSTT